MAPFPSQPSKNLREGAGGGEKILFEEIKGKALSLGWDDIGITEAKIPEEDIAAYREWLESGYHGDLSYMEKSLRCSPEELFPGAKSAVLFISYYKQPSLPLSGEKGLIASYARGRDYHNVHRRRLLKMIRWLEERSGESGIAKGFSDSTPVMEKALAVQAGLGWFGKNSLLIHRKFGTYTLLSGLFTSLKLPSTATKNLRLPKCGSCTRCIDACPTNALETPYLLDARRCLSYHTIESKKAIPPEIARKNPGYAFGCDICQEACPHNVRKEPSACEEFSPERGIGNYLDKEALASIERDPALLYGTPLKRRGKEGLLYNASLLALNQQ